MEDWILVAICCIASGAVAALADPVLTGLRRRWRQRERAKWQVHLIDPDGVPMRTASMDDTAVARFITDLNAGRFA